MRLRGELYESLSKENKKEMKKFLRSIRHMFMKQDSNALIISMLVNANQNL